MPDSVPSNAVISPDALFQDADRLLIAHTKRTPQFEKLDVIINQLETTSSPTDLGRRSFYLARLKFAIGDADAAARHLIENVDDDSPALIGERAELAAQIARALSTGKYRNVYYRTAKPAFVFGALAEAAGRQSANQASLIELHSLLQEKKEFAALRVARDLVSRDTAYLDEALGVVTRIYRRPYQEETARKVEAMLRGLRRTPVGKLLADGVFALKLDAQTRTARSDPSAAPDVGEVLAFLNERGSAGARELIRMKHVFLSAYEGDETIKNAIIETYGEIVRPGASPQIAKRYLEFASQTRKFWSDPSYREAILRKVRNAIEHSDAGEAEFLRGVDDFLSGRPAYIDHFTRAAELEQLIAQSGASSLFADLNPGDEEGLTEIATDFGDVEKTSHAYVCCADLRYFRRYAKRYAQSAREQGDMTRLHFHIAAPSIEDARKAFAEELADQQNLSFSWERPAFSVPTYYASMRFLRAVDFLTHVAGRLVLTDIDVIFTKSPAIFLEHLGSSDYDAGFRVYDEVRMVQVAKNESRIYRYPRLRPWAIVNAACLYLTSSKDNLAAAQVARDMRQYLGRALRTKESAWWIDQNSLYTSIQALMQLDGVQLANIEDHGLPFGSFDYDNAVRFPGKHPSFTSLD